MAERAAHAAAIMAQAALDVKVILTPPCIFHSCDSLYKIYRVASE
jgi:hypothetical protein